MVKSTNFSDRHHATFRQCLDASWLSLLKATRAGAVKSKYRKAAATARPGELDSMLDRLQMLNGLGILEQSVVAAIEGLDRGPRSPNHTEDRPEAIMVFTGLSEAHPVVGDVPPAERVISLVASIADEFRHVVAYAGASPAEILFHEACEARHIPSFVCLSHAGSDYRFNNVRQWGEPWGSAFDRLTNRLPVYRLQSGPDLPAWVPREVTLRKRTNLWLMHLAIQHDCPIYLVVPAGTTAAEVEDLIKRFPDANIRTRTVDLGGAFKQE